MNSKGVPKYYLVLFFLCFLLCTLSTNTLTVKATSSATDSDLLQSDQDAINNVPDGLLLNKYFTIKDPTNNSSDDSFRFKSNDAFFSNNKEVLVLAHGNKTNSADNTTTNFFQNSYAVSNATGSYGSAWSDMSGGTYFEADKDQTISAWMSFGPGGNSEINNGQGIALVLQNNSDGSTEMGAGQEGLGVYGYDKSEANLGSATIATPSYTASTAIQHSIALEFDTQLQDSYKKNYGPIIFTKKLNPYYASVNNFDAKDTNNINLKPVSGNFPEGTRLGPGGGTGHIALSYPADPATYVATKTPATGDDTSSIFYPFETGISMFHIDPQGANLVDDTDANGNDIIWHHVTFHWQPASDLKTALVTYSYNDKLTDGSINHVERVDDSVTVDMSQLGTLNSDKRIYWGFTGANNNLSANVASKLVSIESIPGLVNASIKTTVKDIDEDKTMFDDPISGSTTADGTDRTVADGDHLKINYNLTYNSGREDWKTIAAKIVLPKNINYDTSSGNIGTITYENGDTEDIPISALTTNSSTNLQTINYKMLQNLGSNDAKNKVADISINGVATNTTKKDVVVAEQPATFTGSDDIESSSTPQFTIKYKKDWSLNLKSTSKDPITLLYQQDGATLNLDADLTYTNKTAPTFAKDDPIYYTIEVGGHTLTYDQTISADTSDLTAEIPLRKVIEDAGLDFWTLFPNNSTKTVTVTARDADGITSNSVTYNVATEPNRLLQLKVSPSLQFQDVNYFSTQKYLKRKGSFDVDVTSYRNPWTLDVSTSELTSGSNIFAGTLVDKTTSKTLNLTNNLVQLAQDSNSYDKQTTTSISDLQNWTTTSGLLLAPDGLSTAGKYNGTMDWTLIDDTNSL